MKHFFILITIFSLTLNHLNAQIDSLKHKNKNENKFVISFGCNINTLRHKFDLLTYPYPYCQYQTSIADPVLDYKDKMYRNAYHDAIIAPTINLDYITKENVNYSFGFGFTGQNRKDNYYYPTDKLAWGSFKNLFFTFQTVYSFLNKKKCNVHPFIGLGTYYGYKELSDNIPWFNWPTDFLRDRSNIFLVQVPFGSAFYKGHIYVALNATLNILCVIDGKQDFDAGNKSFYSEHIHYSKTIFIDKIVNENFFLTNVRLKLGFLF